MKTKITHSEYLQLVGLKMLADKKRTEQEDIYNSVKEIIGDTDSDPGRVTSFVIDASLDNFLAWLNVEVEKK